MTHTQAPSKKTVAVLVLLASTQAASAAPLGVDECFQAALRKSETVAIQEEATYQAGETYKQAIGSLLPNLSATASYFQQGVPSTISPVLNETEKTAKLTGTQPLFVAPAYPILKQTKLTVESQEQSTKQTRIVLYQNVVNSFYQAIAAERDIANLQKESSMYTDWVKQLQAWVEIGRARPSDVTQIQASLFTLYATEEASKLTLAQARQTLAFYTGLASDVPLQDPYPEIFQQGIDTLDRYLAKIQDRPDVKTFALARDAADYGIDAAKYEHLPTVNITGDYYLAGSGYSNGLTGGTWDFTLSLTLPLYSGGVIQSKVRQAASQYREGELGLSQNMRQADEQIRTYYQQVQLDHSQLIQLKQAKDYAWTNYHQEMHDFRLGLVTNIDVLTSMTTFEQAERTYDKEKYQEKTDFLYLQSIVGRAKDITF